MKPAEFSIRDDFPATNRKQWLALVERALDGASFEGELVKQTCEGIELQPLYTREDLPHHDDPSGLPGLPPFTRGSHPLGNVAHGWDIRQEHDAPSLEEVNQAVFEDVNNGVTSVVIRLDTAARSASLSPNHGQAAVSGDGAPIRTSQGLERVLKGIDLRCATIALDAGASFLPAATWLAWAWSRRAMAPSTAHGAFNADPLGALAEHVALGEHATRGAHATVADLSTPDDRSALPIPTDRALAQLGALALWTVRKWPHATSIGVDTSAYHRAGATAVQQLAFSIATGIEYLRAATRAGVELSAAARQIAFTYSVDCRVFMTIAKLRAARLLWARVTEASGARQDARRMRMHVRLGERALTRHDPHSNLIRATAGGFAASVAGADSVAIAPFDAPLGHPESFSRRMARNTQLILMHEAHLHRVVDPAGGSYALEKLTSELAESAWRLLQRIEARGGMARALDKGWISLQLETARLARLEHRLADRASTSSDHAFADYDGGPPSSLVPFQAIGETRSAIAPLPIVSAAAVAPSICDQADPTLNDVRAMATAPAAAGSCRLVTAVSAAVAAGASLDELIPALATGATEGQP